MSATAEDLYHRYRFTVEEYLRMADAGILSEDDHVELIEGEIIDMPPIGITHSGSVNRIANKLKEQVGIRAILSVQNPIRIGDFSLPQPDIALLKPRDDFYTGAYPTPDDVLMLVEVAETSVRYDREKKMPLYAAAGVAETWLVDIPAGELFIHQGASPNGYLNVASAADLARVAPTALPDCAIDLSSLFE